MQTEARRRVRPGRRTNIALLVLLPVAVLTGLFANTIGTRWPIAPAFVHGVVGFAMVGLIPWKSVIVKRGLARRRATVVVSIVLMVTVLAVIATGFLHIAGYRGDIGPFTLMQVHIGGAFLALGAGWLHYRAHPVRIRTTDLDRRAFLRSAGLAAASVGAWVAVDRGLGVLGWSGAERRFTGSHEVSSFDPSGMPVTQWFDDTVQRIDSDDWAIRVAGERLDLEGLADLPHEDVTAILDCTSGWYSEQVWTGIRLDRLIDPGEHRSIDVTSATGYGRRFPVRDLDRLWLVTHVGGEPLRAGHGFPARIVAPDRRGFWWVKWVTAIEPSNVPWWIQLPFPVT